MRQISVGSLCTEFNELLRKNSYSSDSLRRYNKAFDEFTEYAGERLYSQQLGAEFLAQKFVAVGGFVEEGLYAKDEMCFFRAMRSLAEYYNFGVLLRRKDMHGEIVWPDPFRECTETFLQSKVKYGVSYGYIKNSKMILKDFLLLLDALDIHNPRDIEYLHVERYSETLLGWSVSTVRSRISLIRCYLRFLYLNGYNKALKNAGIEAKREGHNGFHTLRHSLATHMLQNGVETSTISDILGHTSPDTVKHYLRADIQNLRKCALEVEVMSYVSE